MRLVSESVALVDADGSGRRLQDECASEVAEGPEELSPDDLASKRYAVTDMLTDLEGGASLDETAVIASCLWQQAAGLLLTGSGHWTGTGKWLLRELAAYDELRRSAYAVDLVYGLRAAATGDVAPLRTTCDEILDAFGGRHFAGYRIRGEDPG